MKKLLKRWLGITALEERHESDLRYVNGAFDDLEAKLTLPEDVAYVGGGRTLQYAVFHILRHLKLGWQIELHENLQELTPTKVEVLKPLKEIKHRVVVVSHPPNHLER